MNREEIIQELRNRGYDAQPQDVVKNGVMKEGIILRTSSNIAPTVYVDDFIRRSLSASEAADACIRIFDSHSNMNFDPSCLTRQTFLLNNAYLGLQKTSDEDIIHYQTEIVWTKVLEPHKKEMRPCFSAQISSLSVMFNSFLNYHESAHMSSNYTLQPTHRLSRVNRQGSRKATASISS